MLVMCVHLCVHAYHMCSPVYACLYVSSPVCARLLYVFICVCMSVMCVHLYVHVCQCVHLYVHVCCVCTHACCVYTHVCMFVGARGQHRVSSLVIMTLSMTQSVSLKPELTSWLA